MDHTATYASPKVLRVPPENRDQICEEVILWPHTIEINHGPIIGNNEIVVDANWYGKHTIRGVCSKSSTNLDTDS
ncbi:hypothetical protein HYFRA_00003083 [Hymenoscyphus fraxineus]|uniref:Uncharacterized protein n=1 Tax=Hymenoscyphus fraxineus TaxID=746836 RepID=A0A9N9KPQ6_9HELO|nr:hypothetical protein HYFRA_00003083 [Hymenoscyphus fraxineus]